MSSGVLSGHVVYVTGASRGIGRSVALGLADAGATVVGIARSSDDLDALAATDPSNGSLAVAAADVGDPMEIAEAFRHAMSDVGPPDLVVAFAGVAEALGPIHLVDADDWWRAVEVDLRGTMLTVREAMRAMLPRRAGRVVTIYGNLGDHQGRYVSAFACAKAAIARLTEVAAVEAETDGILVVGVHPGFVRTPMTESLAWGEAGTTWLPDFGHRAERRWGDAAAAVGLVVRVALGEADDLAGRILRVGDDLSQLANLAEADLDLRRLRLPLT